MTCKQINLSASKLVPSASKQVMCASKSQCTASKTCSLVNFNKKTVYPNDCLIQVHGYLTFISFQLSLLQ